MDAQQNFQYDNFKRQLESIDIKHYQVKTDSIRVSPKTYTEFVVFEKKWHEVTRNYFEFETLNGNIVEVKPDIYGIPTVSWLFNDSKYRNSKEREEYSWGSFSSIINDMRTPYNSGSIQLNMDLKAHMKEAFKVSGVYSVWLHTIKGKVAGITRTYNDNIREVDILDAIFSKGFVNSLEGIYPKFRSNEKNVSFYMTIKGLSKVKLVVKNGFAGDTALSYHLVILEKQSQDPLYISKPISRNLHKGRLGDTIENLIEQLEGIRSHEVLNRLERTFGIETMLKIHKIIGNLEELQAIDYPSSSPLKVIKRVKVSEKAIQRLGEAFESATYNVEEKTGFEVLERLKECAEFEKCSTNMDYIIEYLFSKELEDSGLLKSIANIDS